MSTAVRRVPLTVIGGFLGAGKTTLLNHWLRGNDAEPQPLRIAVLVNDFGSLNVDASLIASRGADLIALTNGCVCCSIGDDLSAALIRVLESGTAFDAVVIEASGVSDPWRIAQIGLADRVLSLGGVVVLVDATLAVTQSRDPLLGDSLARTVRAADLLVLNKADLATPGEMQAAQHWLQSLVPDTPVVCVQNAALPLELLTPMVLPVAQTQRLAHGEAHLREPVQESVPEPVREPMQDSVRVPLQESVPESVPAPVREPTQEPEQAHERAADLLGARPTQRQSPHGTPTLGQPGAARYALQGNPAHALRFETWSAQPEAVLSVDTWRGWVRALPTGVLRLKGLVRSVEHGWTELQFAGRHSSVRPAVAAPPHGPALIAIGLAGQLPHEALTRALLQMTGGQVLPFAPSLS